MFMNLSMESAALLLNFKEVKEKNKHPLPAVQTANKFPLILVAEEDDDTRLMMKYLLDLWNYRIVEAANDDEAFQTAKSHRPDLILISDKFRRIDGLSIIRRIRELKELDKAIIIFINGYAEPSIHASALAVGANDCIIKPIDFGQLETKLERFLKKDNKSKPRFGGENL